MKSDSYLKPRIVVQKVEAIQLLGGAPLLEDAYDVNPHRGIFILADGFGGGAGQHVAQLAVQSVRQFLEQEAGDLDATLPFELRSYYSLAGNVLFNAVAYANQKVMQFNASRPAAERGGASLLAGYVEGRLLALANVGATQIVMSRGGVGRALVQPRTLAQQINPFGDETTPGALIPLMSLGTAKQLEPEITEVELKEGDQLCFFTGRMGGLDLDQLFRLETGAQFSQWAQNRQVSAIHHQMSNHSLIWVTF